MVPDYVSLHPGYAGWLFTGIGAVVFRTIHLFFLMDIQSGLVWTTKILTAPFHDIKIYLRAPRYLINGDMYNDISEWYTKVPAEVQ